MAGTTDSDTVHIYIFVGVVCLFRGGVGLEYGLVSLGLHCFLRLERALERAVCWRSGRCLVGVAFSVSHIYSAVAARPDVYEYVSAAV